MPGYAARTCANTSGDVILHDSRPRFSLFLRQSAWCGCQSSAAHILNANASCGGSTLLHQCASADSPVPAALKLNTEPAEQLRGLLAGKQTEPAWIRFTSLGTHEVYQAGVMEVKVQGVGSARGVAPSGLNHPIPKPSPVQSHQRLLPASQQASQQDDTANFGRCKRDKCAKLSERVLTVEVAVRQVLRQRRIHDALARVVRLQAWQ